MKKTMGLMALIYVLNGCGSKVEEVTLEDEIREVVEFAKNNGDKPIVKGNLRFFLEYNDDSKDSEKPNGVIDEYDSLFIKILAKKNNESVGLVWFKDGGLNGYFNRIGSMDMAENIQGGGVPYAKEMVKGNPLPHEMTMEQLKKTQKAYQHVLRDVRAEIRTLLKRR
ncbi:MAG: hypothetical protein KAT77_05955 [Nanoarchaeota archaeon]|nr:hypothetical protein [Nanoarchaeota archaeon]